MDSGFRRNEGMTPLIMLFDQLRMSGAMEILDSSLRSE